MKRGLSVVGKRFGSWLVLSESSRLDKSGKRARRVAECVCDCGKKRIVIVAYLINGNSMSCGCSLLIHGESHANTTEYHIWCSMKQRCANRNHKHWQRYGGRGIKVCERWLKSYSLFLQDMGRRPGHEYSIERIDNDGNYEPGNCKWATAKQQQRNRRDTRRITFHNKTLCAADWARELNLPITTFKRRLSKGLILNAL